ncbi:restriction endonuclease [Mycobacterium paraense]|uniref:restriction endonuclease n=1 Tax=Mycobacterium paraense TaxID=767916 RepID=UPI000A165B7B|nr:restriction endonuclease [Mycobacterium paraense]MCV7441303.1 restriction endonuclease [Mycobacterium paraense]ORW48897.1 restriction endonuclease [Mycobacterium paraense]
MEKILGSSLLLGFALPWFFTQRATGSVVAGFWAGLGGLVLTVVALLWLGVRRDRYRTERQRRRDLRYAMSDLAAVDDMSGIEFEAFVAAQLRTVGWGVTHTASTGDYGVDLVAQKDGTRMAVQCKRQAKAVGVAAVQQVVAGARQHGCDRAVVVTNQAFTKAARQLAATHRCRLVGREQLHIWTRAERRRVQPGMES